MAAIGPYSPAAIFMACVGLGDREAELAFNPRQDNVPYPVHADLLGADPRQDAADPGPQAVIAAGGDRPPVPVAEQLPARRGVPPLAVLGEPGHQGGRDRLPADGLPFLAQPDQALAGVEVIGPQRERPAAPAGGLGVQPQQQRIQLWIIAAVCGGLADLGEPQVVAAAGRVLFEENMADALVRDLSGA